MTDTPTTENAGETPAATPTPEQAGALKISQRVIGQYVRDMSFENVMMQKGLQGDLQPEIAVTVNLDAKKRFAANQYEVITKLNVTNKSKTNGDILFILEIEYAGIFQIEGVPDDQMFPYLMIECPRITFPFIRRIVSDVTRDGGFPPLNLEMIDFVTIYRNEIQRRVQAQAQAASAAAKAEGQVQ